MIVFDDMKVAEKLMVYDKGVNVISGENIEYSDYVVRIREGDVLLPFVAPGDALYNSLDHFAQCILGNKPSISGPEQAIRLLNILYEADNRMNK